MQDENHRGLMQFGPCDQYLDVCQDTLEYVHFERTQKMVSVSPGLVKQFTPPYLVFPLYCVCVCVHIHTVRQQN